MNVLSVPKDGSEVGCHVDNSVALNQSFFRIILAHEVTVFYVSVPLQMKGGQLLLYPTNQYSNVMIFKNKDAEFCNEFLSSDNLSNHIELESSNELESKIILYRIIHLVIMTFET